LPGPAHASQRLHTPTSRGWADETLGIESGDVHDANRASLEDDRVDVRGETLGGRTLTEWELLDAARGGDADAFRLLVEPHRAGVLASCYRMLGSLDDAEDARQEALLRAWRGLCGFGGQASFGSWLYRVTTNACLDALARRQKRVLPIDYRQEEEERLAQEPDGPVVKSAPAARYEQREAVELAFVTALQYLPPRQRAVLILREVLGFSAKEVAELLGTNVASVNSLLQRARKAVDERVPEKGHRATLRSLGGKRVREIVNRFVDAFERGDVDVVVALLAEDDPEQSAA
jgi:RNA polymerase sigma-70 factor, ECF subfamily